MPRKQRTPLPLPERKALAIAARDALDAVIYQFHQASSGWESTAESSSLGARQAVEVVSLLKSANRERDELAAANLAANKRIVELEHERDEWMRRAEGWESEAAIATERFNRLAAAQPGEPLDMDCGDSSCAFAKTRSGMRTNGGCRCLENLGFCRGQTDSLRRMAAEIVSLRKRLSDLTTPRPIAEAPRDGTWIVGFWDDAPPKVIRRWAEQWRDYMGASVAWRGLTHFLPLPVLP